MKTLVLGLGNPILSDDGVGLHVARTLQSKINQSEITVMESSMSGLSLLELLIGFDRAIIIDAIHTGEGKVAGIYRLDPSVFDATHPAAITHDVSFAAALEFGNRLGLALPQKITIFAIEVGDVSNFSEEFTAEVECAIPVCLEKVIQELNEERMCTSSPLPKYFRNCVD